METNEISELAKTHTAAIFALGLTKAEVVMLMACVQARVLEKLIEVGPAIPLAPVKADVVAKPLGGKIADKGYPCVCVACAKHIYTLNRDLYDNTTIKEFIEAYTPMPGYPKITKQVKISNIDGNITMNCPDCNGEFTLYLAGRKIG